MLGFAIGFVLGILTAVFLVKRALNWAAEIEHEERVEESGEVFWTRHKVEKEEKK